MKHLPAGKTGGFQGRECGKDHARHNGKAPRGTFVYGVVTAVPVQVEWPVVEIDDVDGGHAKFEKGNMVVFDGPGTIQEISCETQALGLSEHDVA
jgi:hypothetical protein